MLGTPSEQVQGVGQERQQRRQAGAHRLRAPGQVHDQAAAKGPCAPPPERCERRLAEAPRPQELRDARRVTLDDVEGRLRGDVTWREPGPASGDHEARVPRCRADGRGDQGPLVGHNHRGAHLEARILQDPLRLGARDVFAGPRRRGIAHRDHGRARDHVIASDHMLGSALALLLQAGAPALETRTVSVAVTDSAGHPVEDLAPDELALVENGVVRDIVQIAPDERPLTVAILVDSSEEISSTYRLYLIAAVKGLVKALPPGSRYGIWVTGDRPRKLVDVGDDRGAVSALGRVAPTGGNTLLDALVEVTTELKKREGERLAVVAVTGMTTEFSSRDRYRVVEECEKRAELYLFFAFDEGSGNFENRNSYDYVMSHLTRKPGGRLERAITAMGSEKVLASFAADLAPTLRVSYETLPELKERKVELQVSRPGVRVRALPGP